MIRDDYTARQVCACVRETERALLSYDLVTDFTSSIICLL